MPLDPLCKRCGRIPRAAHRASVGVRGNAARENFLWRVDGSPAIETDRLLIYDNILRHQILYVYALANNITQVAVGDPTD